MIPEALQHPGMHSESLREYAVVFSLVLTWSGSHRGFLKPGIKGNSHGTYLYKCCRETKDTCLWNDCTFWSFQMLWASARLCQSRCICSTLVLSMMLGVCWSNLRPCIFWCILLLSFGCKVLKGEEHFSSLLCLPNMCCCCLWSHQKPSPWGCWAQCRAHSGQTTAYSLQDTCHLQKCKPASQRDQSLGLSFPITLTVSPGAQSASSSPREIYPLHSFCLLSSQAALITLSASRDRSWWTEWGGIAGRAEAIRKRWQRCDRRHGCALPSFHEAAPLTWGPLGQSAYVSSSPW